MAESLLPSRVEPGDPIRAPHISEILQFVKAHRQYEAGFLSGAFKVTRRISKSVDIENSVDTAYCLIEGSIPACEFNTQERKFKPGLYLIDGGVTLLEWEEGGEFLIPMKRVDPETEEEKEQKRVGVNVCGFDIEASTDYPVIGKGAVETVVIQKGDGDTGGGGLGFFSGNSENEQITEERFSIDNVIELRMIPGFNAEDIEIQIPYKELGNRKYRQGRNICTS